MIFAFHITQVGAQEFMHGLFSYHFSFLETHGFALTFFFTSSTRMKEELRQQYYFKHYCNGAVSEEIKSFSILETILET